MAWMVAVGASREASEAPEEAGSAARQAGKRECSWPLFLADLLLRMVPSPCGDPGPRLWAPSGHQAHTECFPTNCSKLAGPARLPYPQALTLWWVRGRAAEGGLRLGGISPFFISLAPVQTDVSFYFELPENRSFLSIVSLGRPPGERSTE